MGTVEESDVSGESLAGPYSFTRRFSRGLLVIESGIGEGERSDLTSTEGPVSFNWRKDRTESSAISPSRMFSRRARSVIFPTSANEQGDVLERSWARAAEIIASFNDEEAQLFDVLVETGRLSLEETLRLRPESGITFCARVCWADMASPESDGVVMSPFGYEVWSTIVEATS